MQHNSPLPEPLHKKSLIVCADTGRLIQADKHSCIQRRAFARKDAKDGKHFADAFDNLTAACNACHEAAHVDFIAIQVPTASPFSNQSFTPKEK